MDFTNMMNTSMNRRPMYSLNKTETKDVEGVLRTVIRAYENGFDDFESAKNALDATLEVYKDYTVTYYNISFVSSHKDEKEEYGYDVDFKKETKE